MVDRGMLRVMVRYVSLAATYLASGIQAWSLWPNRVRIALLRGWGVSCDPRAEIGPRCFFSGPNVKLGECFINREVHFDVGVGSTIVIEDGCEIGQRTTLLTSHHEIGGRERRAGAPSLRSIVIGRGSWLGAGVTVLPGVTIGAGCVIGAGAVVSRDCEPDGLYVGVPARRIRGLE